MSDRTCASCGAKVGILVDRCPACGADPDLHLIELGVGAGRRRRAGPPPGDHERRRPRRRIGWRQWAPIAAAVLGLWGFLIATAGEEGDEDDSTEQAEPESSTSSQKREQPTPSTRRGPRAPTTTTSTTTVIEGAPFVAEETGLVVVFMGERNRVVELDTGVTRRMPRDVMVWAAFGDRLLVRDERGMAWWPAPFDGTGEQRLDAAWAEQGWIDPSGELLWLFRSGPPGEQELVLADMTGGTVAEHQLPIDVWPVGVVRGGIVLNAPGGTFVRDIDGDVRRISTGAAIGAGGDRVFVNRCDERLECGIETLGVDGEVLDQRAGAASAGTPLGPYGYAAAVSVDGHLAQMVDIDGTTTVAVDGARVEGLPVTPGPGAAAWAPHGRYLFITSVAGAVYVVDPAGPAVIADFPGERGESVWQLLVVDVDG